MQRSLDISKLLVFNSEQQHIEADSEEEIVHLVHHACRTERVSTSIPAR